MQFAGFVSFFLTACDDGCVSLDCVRDMNAVYSEMLMSTLRAANRRKGMVTYVACVSDSIIVCSICAVSLCCCSKKPIETSKLILPTSY